jgi:hypothetical protein
MRTPLELKVLWVDPRRLVGKPVVLSEYSPLDEHVLNLSQCHMSGVHSWAARKLEMTSHTAKPPLMAIDGISQVCFSSIEGRVEANDFSRT